jgi:hypothetical protein
MAVYCMIEDEPLNKKLIEAVGMVAAYSYYNKHKGDIDHLASLSVAEIAEQVKGISHDKKHTAPLSHLKIKLKEKLMNLKKSKFNDRAVREAQIERQLAKLEGVEAIEGIASVVDYLYDETIGEMVDGKPTGQVSKLEDYIHAIDADMVNIDGLSEKDKSKKLQEIQARLNSYNDFADNLGEIGEFESLYSKTMAERLTAVEGSTLWKIQKLMEAKKKIKELYDDNVTPITAKILAVNMGENANKQVLQEYQATLKRLKKEEDAGKDVTEKLEKARKKFEEHYVDEGSLTKALRYISKDIPFLDSRLVSIISVADSSISLFAKFVKRGLYETQQALRTWKFGVNKEYEKYIKATGHSKNKPHKVNEAFTEVYIDYVFNDDGTVEERRHNAFIQEIDYSAFNIAKQKAAEKIKQLPENERKDAWVAWYKANTQSIPVNSKVEFGREIKGIKDIILEKVDQYNRKLIGKEQFESWVKDNIYDRTAYDNNRILVDKEDGSQAKELDIEGYAKEVIDRFADGTGVSKLSYRGELSMPKKSIYTNKKWQKLMSGPSPERDYYTYMVTEYLAAQEEYGESARLGYKLPYIYKDKREHISAGKLKGAGKAFVQENFKMTERDMEQYGDFYTKDKTIPIRHVHYISAEESSIDVFQSIVEYKKSAMLYTKYGEMLPTAKSMMNLISTRETLQDDGRGGNFKSKAAKALGLDNYINKTDKSNASWMIDEFFNQQFLGQMNVKEFINTPMGQIDAGKQISNLMSFASMTMLGGPEALKSVANSIQAKLQSSIEAFAKEHLAHKNLVYGEKEFAKHSKNIFSDFASGMSTSLEGQLVDKYDMIQGKFLDEFGNNISGSAFKKMAVSGTWMFANNFSEYQSQISFGFGLMDTVRLRDASGKEINLKQAHELGPDGVIKIKDGVTKLDGTPFLDGDDFRFTSKLHGINKGLHGVYNSFDRPLSKKWSVMRLLLMFKGFLTPTVKKRFKAYGVNQEIDTATEGFHITFYKALWNQKNDLIALLMKKEHSLTPMQVANIRRSAMEISIMATLTVATLALTGLGDDDEELKKNWGYQFALYEMTRAGSELRFYVPILGAKDQLRLFTSPSAMNGFAERLFKAGAQTFGITSDEGFAFNDNYKVKSGWNEKGDSKLLSRYMMLLGFNGNNLNPAQATEIFHKL